MTLSEFKTKNQIIYEALKEDIINGKYEPQQRIIISQVAKEFGASEIPVREAIKHLESDGLVQSTPYIGVAVTSFDMEDVAKIYQIRGVLEGLAAKLAAQNIKEKDLKLLGKQINAMQKAVNTKKYERLGLLNKELHRGIYSACGNQYLYKLIFELWDLSFRTRGVFALVPERAYQSLREHKEILKALEKRDGDLAAKLIVEQKEDSLSALLAYFKDHGTEDDRIVQNNKGGS